MIGLCFSFSKDLMQREYWSYICYQNKIDNVWEVGRPDDAETNYKPTSINNYSELPKENLIIVQHKNAKYIQGKIPLTEFKHPEDGIYVFGSDSANLYPEMFENHSYETLYIPPSNIEMYSFQAGAIVMYDIWNKLNG